ncbi:MAG: hypothetical protein JWP22_3407 [Ramlibacter sp.]|nr:hypothetical protein [Ramlibacter sp.]
MNEEALNASIRKFLKLVGVSSQREIEQAVARAMRENAVTGGEAFPAVMTLEVPGLKLRVAFDGEIRLQ